MEHDAVRVERYRARAADLMVMAAASKTQGLKAEFLALAAEYKRLANAVESGFSGGRLLRDRDDSG